MKTDKRFGMRSAVAVVASVLACGAAAPAGAQVQLQYKESWDARLQGLYGLYKDDDVTFVWSTCMGRLKQSPGPWLDALSKWHEGNRASIEELKRLDEQLGAALHAHTRVAREDFDTWASLVSLRYIWMNYQIGALVGDDAQVKAYCDGRRELYAHKIISSAEMDEVRASVAAAQEFLARQH